VKFPVEAVGKPQNFEFSRQKVLCFQGSIFSKESFSTASLDRGPHGRRSLNAACTCDRAKQTLPTVKKLCSDDPEALDLWDRVTVGKQGNPTGTNPYTEKGGNVDMSTFPNRSSPTGNKKQRALRRLRTARPDLRGDGWSQEGRSGNERSRICQSPYASRLTQESVGKGE